MSMNIARCLNPKCLMTFEMTIWEQTDFTCLACGTKII